MVAGWSALVKCVDSQLGLMSNDSKEGFGWARGFAAILFPVLEGLDANANEFGEVGLGEFGAFADLANAGGDDLGATAGLGFAAEDGSAFTDAFDEVIE